MRANGSTARMLLLGLGLSVQGCRTSAPTVAAEPTPAPSVSNTATDRCLRYAGDPTDPDLRGRTRTHAVRCCPSDYGFDPTLARDACGFAEYLGESEELACVHRFRASDGQLHELRITPVVELELDDAVALHELSAGPSEAPAQSPELRWSSADGRRWAFVPGWSIVRRLGWDEAACAADRMLPVLARMRAADDDPSAAIPLPRLHDDTPRDESLPAESLLDREIATPEHSHRYPLPRSAELAAIGQANARVGIEQRGEALEVVGDRGVQERVDEQLGAAWQRVA
ncbi:MAG TPA: hypothetical protein VM869_30805, partial [Enhygromyxa sp.]|nr:hypothetical protein [Enhygromyxa sp.]